MKRITRFHIAVVLCLALALSAAAPAVAHAQEGNPPMSAACVAALAALNSYYQGEISKAEADAAVARCEAETQGNQGDGPGQGDQGQGNQGQNVQASHETTSNQNQYDTPVDRGGQDSSSLPPLPLSAVSAWVVDQINNPPSDLHTYGLDLLRHLRNGNNRCFNSHILVQIPLHFPGVDVNRHWAHQRVKIKNPFRGSTECTGGADPKADNIALWANPENRPPGRCEVAPRRSDEDVPINPGDEIRSWAVWLIAPNLMTGEFLRDPIATGDNKEDMLQFMEGVDCSVLFFNRP